MSKETEPQKDNWLAPGDVARKIRAWIWPQVSLSPEPLYLTVDDD